MHFATELQGKPPRVTDLPFTYKHDKGTYPLSVQFFKADVFDVIIIYEWLSLTFKTHNSLTLLITSKHCKEWSNCNYSRQCVDCRLFNLNICMNKDKPFRTVPAKLSISRGPFSLLRQ